MPELAWTAVQVAMQISHQTSTHINTTICHIHLVYAVYFNSSMWVQVTKHILGQSVFQLGVMYTLVFFGDQLFGVPSASTIHGPSQHYTLVFNAFVLMQLFNQVSLVLSLPRQPNSACFGRCLQAVHLCGIPS